MARILITNLGTGKKEDGGYKRTDYCFNERVWPNESAIARVLAEGIAADRILMFGTRGSIWDWAYESFGGADADYDLTLYEKKERGAVENADLLPLAGQLQRFLHGEQPSHCYLIRYGQSEEELDENFGLFLAAAQAIADGDELYLDITHSFRSLAFMSYIMLDYLQAIGRRFELKGVYYGMLEVKTTPTPVVDLLPLYRFGQWSRAISYFREYGNPQPISRLVGSTFPEEKALEREYRLFSEAFALGYMPAIKPRLESIACLPEQRGHPLLGHVMKELCEVSKDLTCETQSGFIYRVARFYQRTCNYGLAYLALQTALETRILELEPDYGRFSDLAKAVYERHLDARSRPWGEMWYLREDVKDMRNLIAHFEKGAEKSVRQHIENLSQYMERAGRLLDL